MASRSIDRDKLRAAVRRLGNEYVYRMLDTAMDLLPPSKLLKLVRRHVDDPSELLSDGTSEGNLLTDVKAFEKASLSGEYYESFSVNSKNFMEQSHGTVAWIAECHRLLGRCVAFEKKGQPAEVRQAFDIVFGLLEHIDRCLDDVIFFADEGGSWQVGVDWDEVLPPWFRALSATATPEEYAGRTTGLLKHHHNCGGEKMLNIARKTATPEQRRALSHVVDRQGGQRPGGGMA